MEENKDPRQNKEEKEINTDRDSPDHAEKGSSSEHTPLDQPFEDQKIVLNESMTRKAGVLSDPEASTIEAQQIPIANINETVKERGDSLTSSASFKDSEVEKGPKGDIKTGSREATKSGKDHLDKDTVLSRYHSLKHEKGLEQKRQNNNVSTMIAIGYTVLILILGFLVYRDLSKRLNNLEEKVLRIENTINERENIPLKEIERYDLH